MKILCIGDSLTFGNVGYSYIPFLSSKYQIFNNGKNGETTIGAYKTLQRMSKNSRKFRDCDLVILSIGTNDVLLPFLRTVSLFWKMQMTVRCKIKHCLEEDEDFYDEYEKCLSFLQQKNKKIIIIDLPFIEMKNFPHDITERRNKKLRDLAEKYNCPFIDIYRIQKSLLKGNKLNYSWKYKYIVRIADYLIMTILPFTKDSFAKFRKLQLTVDGAHFNSLSAKALAKEVELSIKN